MNNIIIAVKCAPEELILDAVRDAGLKAVELYIDDFWLYKIDQVIRTCEKYSLRYALHAPNKGYNPHNLAELVKTIGAEIVVFHNIYWEDEWEDITKIFKNIKTKLCVENTSSVHEPVKFIRRYNMGRCLDLEHAQMECAGVYEEVFISILRESAHIHLTGYVYGSQLWHTHIHCSPEHNLYILDLLKKASYSGFVVSEAKVSLQTYEEFKKLNDFYEMWKSNSNVR